MRVQDPESGNTSPDWIRHLFLHPIPLGRFPVDLVERALLDEGADMIPILAKAAGCSWTTARELLVMYHAKRNLKPDDLTRAFERYKKLCQKTARNIVNFHERRMKLRVQENPQAENASVQYATTGTSTQKSSVRMPSAFRDLAEVPA